MATRKVRFVTPFIRRAARDRRLRIHAAASWIELVYRGLRRIGAAVSRRYRNQMSIEYKGGIYIGKFNHHSHDITISPWGNARPTVIIRSLKDAVDFYEHPCLFLTRTPKTRAVQLGRRAA